MFETSIEATAPGGDLSGSGVDADLVAGWCEALVGGLGASDDPGRLRLIRELERLACAAAAAQAVLTVQFDESQRAAQAAEGVLVHRRGRGVAAQIALARRESPHRGQRDLGLATVLHAEMPWTMAAFRAGEITEWVATILARETACLDLPDRRAVDETWQATCRSSRG